jgi:hypothetical protein
MHYCIHLLTKQLPTEKEIEKIMEPYSWDSIDDEDTDDEKKKNRISGVYVGLVSDWRKIQCLPQTKSRWRRFRKQIAL